MKKSMIVSCAAVAALAGIGAPASANTITLNDSGVHHFDGSTAIMNLHNSTTLHVHEPADITVRLNAHNQSKTHLHGGSIQRIDVFHQAAIEMLGGYSKELHAFNSSSVEIRGGTLEWLYINDNSKVEIHGMADLELVPFPGWSHYTRYRVLGTLLDGTQSGTWVWLDHSQGADAEINLVIHAIPLPGPAGMVLAGLGAICIVTRRRG